MHTQDRKFPIEDKTWLALTASLSALTDLLRFTAGESNIEKEDAMGIAADAIRAIVVALDDFNI